MMKVVASIRNYGKPTPWKTVFVGNYFLKRRAVIEICTKVEAR